MQRNTKNEEGVMLGGSDSGNGSVHWKKRKKKHVLPPNVAIRKFYICCR